VVCEGLNLQSVQDAYIERVMKFVLTLALGSVIALSGCASSAKKQACAAPSKASCCSGKTVVKTDSCCKKKN
jgi:hypothetical protein